MKKLSYRPNLLLLFLLFVCSPVYATLSLPEIRIEIDASYLQQLEKNPWTETWFPATFYAYDSIMPCHLHFRGSSTRELPKKSWSVKLEDRDNPFAAKSINLNAEYCDKSLLRNYLAMSLFQYFNCLSPDTRHVNLFVNDKYQGVYLFVEEVDNTFFNKRGLPDGDLYKTLNHGAIMAPLAHFDDYATTWEKKEGLSSEYSDLQNLFNKLLYLPDKEFNNLINSIMDIEKILTYFAIEYAIASEDCFTKNMYWYCNPDNKKWVIVPWDNDGTFGNNWQGIYLTDRESIYRIECMYHNLLLQRILQKEEWNNLFVEKVNSVLKEGFTNLATILDSTYNVIKNDVWRDSAKICTNTEFDNEILRIHTFLKNRTLNNGDKISFPKIALYDFYCSNPNPTPEDNKIIFRVTSEAKQNVTVNYCTDLQWDVRGDSITINSLKLWDDGKHNDSLAGDLIYGNELILTLPNSNLVPFCFVGSQNYYPQNGLYYLPYVRTHTMTLLYSKTKNPVENIRIGKVHAHSGKYVIELLNTGSRSVDLSCCHIRVDTCYQDFMIPEKTILPGNNSIYIASDMSFCSSLAGFSPAVGNMCFDIAPGDSIYLLSPLLTPITASICPDFEMIEYKKINLVINEINYHSSPKFDPGDWLELYNPNQFDVDVSGWLFKDERDDHVFMIPLATTIDANGYLVLCENKVYFSGLFQKVRNVTGNFTFGLDNGGELLRLFDSGGKLVDSVRYDDKYPWPLEADGDGPTLELLQSDNDNSYAGNWSVSLGHGTPGTVNSTTLQIASTSRQVGSLIVEKNYPNPFNSETTFNYCLYKDTPVLITVYDMLGRHVKTLCDDFQPAGAYHTIWNGTDATGNVTASGLYFIRIKTNDGVYNQKVLMLK